MRNHVSIIFTEHLHRYGIEIIVEPINSRFNRILSPKHGTKTETSIFLLKLLEWKDVGKE